MLCAGAGIRHGLRWGAFALAAALLWSALADNADARSRRKYQPAYASIVVDANTGKVLQATNAKDSRYPASLTKVMTLYLLFEQLESGKLKLDSQLKVSSHASRKPPSKLALKPGETITVSSAIKALVTKSANDIAAVVAEAIAGDEEEFAKLMTRKARMLGMQDTVYRNASGLPDDEQVTTANDQALLGRAIRDRFPKYYAYFAMEDFHFRGKRMENHNKLLGRVDGVDGIKTGYTYASGFNLLAAAQRGDRYVVAVVIGGRSGKWRDNRMTYLINRYIAKASKKRTVPTITDVIAMPRARPQVAVAVADAGPEQKLAAKLEPKPEKTSEAKPHPLPEPVASRGADPAPAAGSTDPIKPNAVKTLAVKSAAATSAMASVPIPARKLSPPPVRPNGVSVRTIVTVKSEPLPAGSPPDMFSFAPIKTASATDDAVVSSTASAKTRSAGWAIQVGAFDEEKDARKRLVKAQAEAKDLLDGASPFTERVTKGEKTLFRARFTGLDKSKAEAACTHLKRGEMPCMLLKN